MQHLKRPNTLKLNEGPELKHWIKVLAFIAHYAWKESMGD